MGHMGEIAKQQLRGVSARRECHRGLGLAATELAMLIVHGHRLGQIRWRRIDQQLMAAYEIVITVLLLVVLSWAIRSRNSFNIIVESECISIGVWTYQQAPEYLLLGVPWSNMWFNAHRIVFRPGPRREMGSDS